MIVETTLQVVEAGELVKVRFRLDTETGAKTRLGRLYQPEGNPSTSQRYSYIGDAVNGRIGFIVVEPDPI